MKKVWTIAGSDSCCGAGAQRDISVMHDLGVYPCMVLTCLTAQSSQAVDCVEPVSESFFNQNIRTLAADLYPDALKIGLIPDLTILGLIRDFIKSLRKNDSGRKPFVLLDPVCIASTGQQISSLADVPAEFHTLFPYVDLLTPNLDELRILSGSERNAESMAEIEQQVAKLRLAGLGNILVKGGHSRDPQYVHDVLFAGDERFILRARRFDTVNTHGTGCTLSSAIVSYMAMDYFLYDAVTAAQMYVSQAIDLGVRPGHGNGTPAFGIAHYQEKYLPQAVSSFAESVPEYHFKTIDEPLGLYPVVDSVEWIERLLACGVKTIQLRIKDPQYPHLEQDIERAVALGEQYGARVFIDDYWQLAVKYHAYGVHLGQEDLLTADLSLISESGIALGVSTHGFYEIARACRINPSYIALGHIFQTRTKVMKSDPQGLERLRLYADLLRDRNTVAIGGIKEKNFSDVLATGVKSIAVVTAITAAEDPEKATAQLLAYFADSRSDKGLQKV